MSRLKKIEGRLTFDDNSNFEEFEKTISLLQKRFTQIEPAPRAITSPASGTAAAGTSAEQTKTSAPFIVTLSFEERFTKPVYQRIWESFEEHLPMLEEAFLKIAGALTPGTTTVKFIADVASEFLKKFTPSATPSAPGSTSPAPGSPSPGTAGADQAGRRQAAFDRIAAQINDWQSKAAQPVKNLKVTPTDVEGIYNAVSSVAASKDPPVTSA